MRNILLGAAVTLSATISSAHAATYTFAGQLSTDDDVDFYQFTVGEESEVTLASSSYVLGGFDPMLWLFAPQGQLITGDDDSGPDWDSLIVRMLSPGTYTVAVSQYNNAPTGSVADPFSRAGETWFRNVFNGRSPNYEFTASGVGSAVSQQPSPVPLPASGALTLLGIGALGLARRKRS